MSVGGEWAGGSLMVIESSPAGKRGFYGSWPQVGPSAGTLLATGAFAVFSTLPDDQFLAWGWRMPFLLSALVVAVGIVIRLKLDESPAFEAVKERDAEEELPIAAAWREHKRQIALVAGMRLAINTTFYVTTVFGLKYATDELGISEGAMLAMILITAALGFVSKPIYGAWSDRVGRKPIYLAGSVTGALFAFPFFGLLETGVFALILLGGFLLINISHDLNDAVESSYFSELFGTKVRYTCAALGHQLGGAITGFAPLVATALSASAGGAWWPVAAFVTVCCAISATCVLASPETDRRRHPCGGADRTLPALTGGRANPALGRIM